MKTEFPTYLVGGAVRDLLLCRPAHDLDWLVVGDYDEVFNAYAQHYRTLPIGRNHNTFVFEKDGERFEVTTCHDVVEQLKTRDFTCNAMAVDSEGNWIDPCGGARDTLDGKLVPVSESNLKADPIRYLRGYRLAIQLGFRYNRSLMKQGLKETEWNIHISPYRGWNELKKLLSLESFSRWNCLSDLREAQHDIFPFTFEKKKRNVVGLKETMHALFQTDEQLKAWMKSFHIPKKERELYG